MNQAYENARNENLKVTESDEEKLVQLNTLNEFRESIKTVSENGGAYRDYSTVTLPPNIPRHKYGNHLKTRSQIPEMHECQYCHKFYPHKQKHLQAHIRLKHPERWPEYWQKNRPRNARTDEIEKYKEHFRYDDSGTNFLCNFCDKPYSFVQPAQFIKHLQARHLGCKFTCDVCGQEFGYAQSLKRHKDEMHENKGRVNCRICGKEYPRFKGLMDHLKCTHPEEYDVEIEKQKKAREEKKAESLKRKMARERAEAEKRELRLAKRRATLPKHVQREIAEILDESE